MQYDVTSTEILTGGTEIWAGYAQGQTTFATNSLPTQVKLGAQDIAGTTPDEYVICAQGITGTETVFGALTWNEL